MFEDWDYTYTIVEDEYIFANWDNPMFVKSDFEPGAKPGTEWLIQWVTKRMNRYVYYEYTNPEIEYWAPLPANLKLSRYEVSTHGNLRWTKHLKKFLNSLTVDGYVINKLINDGGIGKQILRHRLIALTFLKNPSDRTMVDHIRPGFQHRCDNRVENLRWATAKENTNNRLASKERNCRKIAQLSMEGELIKVWNGVHLIEKEFNYSSTVILNVCKGYKQSSFGFKWNYHEPDIPGEIWKEYKTASGSVQVSDQGRIKKTIGGLTVGTLFNGYYSVIVGGKQYRVHRLVCEAFHGPASSDKQTVDHINSENKLDNRACNLRWANSTEQNQNRRNFGKSKVIPCRAVYAKNRNTGKITKFVSVKAATEYTGRHKVTIIGYLKGKLRHPTCDWYYTDGGKTHTNKADD